MDKLSEIKGYVAQMQVKKAWFGGYRKEDVQKKLDTMMELFEKTMEERDKKEAELRLKFEKEKQALVEDFESKKKVSDILVNDLSRNIDELNEENHSLGQECLQLKDAYNDISLIKENLEKEQEKLKQAYDALMAESQQMAENQIKMKETYRLYCGEILREYSESLRSLSGEFSRILKNVSSMQKEIDEESLFDDLERVFESREAQVLTGTVE